ncbi:MAG: DUF4386 family protein [Candidatus Devosia phytovorans]|uniref:DUF4386 family protein n=1 Tax=Candidatus Devosia phytovorans TaxID=3121372 RepID=A0AAJ6B0V5_9HYPH|nr:DUF4386 family protein [Devosia sp.]WEK06110.1 MAG: DUF4386 family protein [Devosia sp.]
MTTLQRSTGLAMIAVPVVFMAAFTGLQMSFHYPDILREPAADILASFSAGGPTLLATWYVFMLSALAFIPVGVLSGLWLWPRHSTAAAFAATFGVLAGLVQGLGLLRWVVLVPSLAATAGDPTTEAVFNAFHLYAGAGIGEHFGYLFTALWTVSVAIALMARYRIIAWTGVLLALGIAAGMAEPFGFAAAGAINAIAYTVWALWLVVLGVVVLRERAV